jgi:hypothetical protein
MTLLNNLPVEFLTRPHGIGDGHEGGECKRASRRMLGRSETQKAAGPVRYRLNMAKIFDELKALAVTQNVSHLVVMDTFFLQWITTS